MNYVERVRCSTSVSQSTSESLVSSVSSSSLSTGRPALRIRETREEKRPVSSLCVHVSLSFAFIFSPFSPLSHRCQSLSSSFPPLLRRALQKIMPSHIIGLHTSLDRIPRGVILTPSEMEALTEPWRPYRSIGRSTICGEKWILGRDVDDFFYTGVYYMWALAEGKAAS